MTSNRFTIGTDLVSVRKRHAHTDGHKVRPYIMWLALSLFIFHFSISPAWAHRTTEPDTIPHRHKMTPLRRTVRGFDRLDTTFIEPQHYIFTVMLQATNNYDIYTLRSAAPNAQSITFSPDMNLRLGPYFAWKWFFLGYTFELGDINLQRIKQQLDLSIYSSQIGIDIFYRRTGNDYKLRDAQLGEGINTSRLEGQPFSGVKAGITGFNAYYIFNHGRFSYPAAFSQSTLQKVSCGSWMAGLGYTKNSLDVDHEKLQRLINRRMGTGSVPLDSGLMIRNVNYNNFSISGGYAYNWVLPHHWLLAASGQLALAYKKSTGDAAGSELQGFSFENVNLDGIGRFGIVYNNMRWYTGASFIVHTNNYRKSRFRANNTFGSMNIYVGYNFGLKRRYR